MSSKFRKFLKVLPNIFMVLGVVSVAFAMLLSMVNLPVAAQQPVDLQCPDGGTEFKTSGVYEGVTVTIDGKTVTFSQEVEFCVKAADGNSGVLTGASYTVDFLNNGNQFPDISHVVVYRVIPTPTPPPPTVSLSKSANPTTLEGGGQFTFTLTIESDQDVSITSLTDTWWGDAGPQGNCSSLTSLKAGVPESCTYSISETSVGSYKNDASVTVANSNGGASDFASATVTVTEKPIIIPLPTVVLEKSVVPESRPEPGGEFIFTLTITNTSSNPVTINELTDTYALSDECEVLVQTQIPAGGSVSCDYPVTETEEGVYNNGASVTVSNGGGSASDDAEATFNVTKVDEPNPDPDQLSVTLDKTVFPSTLPKPGGDFTFTLLITNTSDESVKIIELEDDHPLSDECKDLIGTQIGADESVNCTYTVNETKVGTYINEASVTVSEVESVSRTASAKDDASFTVTDKQTTEVPGDPDPSGTPDPTETQDPGKTPEPAATPVPVDDEDEPNPTLAPPTTSNDPAVLIPVTGIEFGTPMNKVQSITFNLGLGLLGVGLVLQAIRKKIQ